MLVRGAIAPRVSTVELYAEAGIPPAEVLRIATIGAARVMKRDNELGSIAPGKLADIVILSRDILRIDPKEIEKVRVVMTIMDGRVVYETAL